ncbi:MAG: LD-carboxypeptidase [Acidobacteria bacterium]|nr:MAG: LD-carboxypeptidase [Acidobacteriota bacterium]
MPASAPASRIKPRALRSGDTIGIVAPASSFKREEFEAGCEALRQMGYKPVYSESIFSHDLYFAGSPDRRIQELEDMFQRDHVKAIICARGGYGANYLLPLLDLPKLAAKPKIIVGYSDITTLLTHFCDAAGFITFHGPMVAKDFAKADGFDPVSWRNAVAGAQNWRLEFSAGSAVKSLGSGSAAGVLYGGCLSMLVASLGTPYEIRTDGTILFIEDIGTKPYQIDRMLMHLKLAGKFAGVRGIIFGEMLDCIQAPNQRYTLEEVVMRVVDDLGIPVAYGLRSGHVSRQNITLPIGVKAALNVDSTSVSLEILEAAVTV